MEFLWVCWFEIDFNHDSGWEARRLDHIQFADSDIPDAFGFLDPSDVIRGAHLISAFAHGKTDAYLPGYSAICEYFKEEAELDDEDWMYYYVNRFVDQDMFVRYLGEGVGHKATNEFTASLRPDFLSTSAQNQASGDGDGDGDGNIDTSNHMDAEDESAQGIEDDGNNRNESEEEDENEGDEEDKPEFQDYEQEDKDEDNELGGGTNLEDEADEYEGEDGEEPWDIDDTKALGYAPL